MAPNSSRPLFSSLFIVNFFHVFSYELFCWCCWFPPKLEPWVDPVLVPLAERSTRCAASHGSPGPPCVGFPGDGNDQGGKQDGSFSDPTSLLREPFQQFTVTRAQKGISPLISFLKCCVHVFSIFKLIAPAVLDFDDCLKISFTSV